MKKTWDVIVIGGGMAGLSTAYYLSKTRAKVLLLQAGDLGGGSSAANAGRAQVNEGHIDPLNVRIIRDGLAGLETLEDELDASFAFKRFGYLCIVKSAEADLWDEWQQRCETLTAGGIPTEMLDLKALQEAEPLMDTKGLLGAAYTREGLLNPFLYTAAYAGAARRNGAEMMPHMPVTAFIVEGERVVSVEAGGETFHADKFIVTCGAWTPVVTRLAGVELPIKHTHAEAFILEPLPLTLNNTIGLADFYRIIHGKARAVAIGVGPSTHGPLLVTEAVFMTGELHQRNSAWGLSATARDLLGLFPALSKARMVRGWGAPTCYTPDNEPVLGWAPGRENLFVSASFQQSITAMPVLGDWTAKMVMGEPLDVDLSPFDPARFDMLPGNTFQSQEVYIHYE